MELPLAGEPLRGFVVELSRIIAMHPLVQLLKLGSASSARSLLCCTSHHHQHHGDPTRSQCAHSAAAHIQSTYYLSNTIYDYTLGAALPDFRAALNIYY